MSHQCPVPSHFPEAKTSKMAFEEKCMAWVDSEITPCLLSIINKRHCGQLLSKIPLWEGLASRWLSQEHLSVLQREARGFRVFPSVIFFWPFEHQQQIFSRILWIRVTAEASQVAVFIANTWWNIPLNRVRILTLTYFDPVMVWKWNYLMPNSEGKWSISCVFHALAANSPKNKSHEYLIILKHF